MKGYRWNNYHPYIIPGIWSGDIFSSSLYHPWPFFIAHANRVVIAKIIKKAETRIVIVFLFIPPLVSRCLVNGTGQRNAPSKIYINLTFLIKSI